MGNGKTGFQGKQNTFLFHVCVLYRTTQALPTDGQTKVESAYDLRELVTSEDD